MNNNIVTVNINQVKNPAGAAKKAALRRQLDLTRHLAFEQGDMCFIWRHSELALEVELRYRFDRGWVCKCKTLDAEAVFPNQAPPRLAQAVADWIDKCQCEDEDEDWLTENLPKTECPKVVRPGVEYGV